MDKVYIVSGCRTGIGSFLGQYANISAVALAATVIEEAFNRAKLQNDEVCQVIMGHVLTAGAGQNTARQAALAAKIPQDVPAYTQNMVCGSGLKAVYDGYTSIKAGESKIVICGGMENMSMAKHCVSARVGKKMGNIQMEDTVLIDGLTDATLKIHMGKTAEHLATTYGVSREDQDKFAMESQRKAQEATANDYFKDEIVGVKDAKGNLIMKDEHIRSTSLEGLAKLTPAFEKGGSVTAGNASGINDGAAALVICSEEMVWDKNLSPLARIVAFAQSGIDPIEMGLGPVKAIQKVLEKAAWSLNEVDLFEINEAFAVQSILVVKSLNIDVEKVNISGGGIALGHPIGASGARVLVTLIYNLRRTKKTKGIASLCIGGGMGIAVAIEIDAVSSP